MSNSFFDDEIFTDDQREESNKDNESSPQDFLNDYRNRMPFHYVSDSVPDGYYYWQAGQTMSMEFILEDEVAFTSGEEDYYVPIVDFLKNSNRKIRFILEDFRGDEIYRSELSSNELSYENDTVVAKFEVTESLSKILVPSQYKLFVYIISYSSIKPGDSSIYPEDYNKPLTENGINIHIRG